MQEYVSALQEIVNEASIVIDRPKGSKHPRYSDYVYELDYGYLEDTVSQDGSGIDVWCGASGNTRITGILLILDPVKKDSEIKLLLGCTDEERVSAQSSSNRGKMIGVSIWEEIL